ncbi:MAG: 50S ribosomal protein L23 [Desulfurococcales archaeon]|nr:50S ribosomal protein L23 [Desulfurococcales archaeon]
MKEPTKVLLYPVSTEKTHLLAEKENTIVFVVAREATKADIKYALEKLYEVKVEKVNTLITPKGQKKAYIKLSKEFSAEELLTRLGVA